MKAQPPSSLPDVAVRRTSGLAIASLVCGLVSFFLFALPSVIAIILGHSARSKIKKSEGKLLGKNMALTGLICGYASLFMVASIVTWVVLDHKESNYNKAAEIAEEVRRGKEIHALVLKYETDHGKFPDKLSELVDQGYVSSLDHLQPENGGNWIYFQGLTSKSDHDKYIIRSQLYKVVIRVDGTSGDRNLSFTAEPTDAPMRHHPSVEE